MWKSTDFLEMNIAQNAMLQKPYWYHQRWKFFALSFNMLVALDPRTHGKMKGFKPQKYRLWPLKWGKRGFLWYPFSVHTQSDVVNIQLLLAWWNPPGDMAGPVFADGETHVVRPEPRKYHTSAEIRTRNSSMMMLFQPKNSSGERKKLCLSIKYWWFNRDPYNGLWQSPHNWVVSHPLYTLYTTCCLWC